MTSPPSPTETLPELEKSLGEVKAPERPSSTSRLPQRVKGKGWVFKEPQKRAK